MDVIHCAKEELRKLRQLYAAQVNLRSAQMLVQEPGGEGTDEQRRRYRTQAIYLQKKTQSLDLRIACVLNALCVLDPEEKQILLLCYAVSGFSPEDIMELLHMEKSTFYRKKKAALENFARALYGCDEKMQ